MVYRKSTREINERVIDLKCGNFVMINTHDNNDSNDILNGNCSLFTSVNSSSPLVSFRTHFSFLSSVKFPRKRVLPSPPLWPRNANTLL